MLSGLVFIREIVNRGHIVNVFIRRDRHSFHDLAAEIK
jgi:hypothetical protein